MELNRCITHNFSCSRLYHVGSRCVYNELSGHINVRTHRNDKKSTPENSQQTEASADALIITASRVILKFEL